MNTAQMLGSLKAFGSLMGDVDAAVLSKFAELFEGMGEAKTVAVVAQINKNWTMLNRAKKRPAQLERALRRIQEALAAIGATAQAGVYSKVLTLVEGHEQQDIDGFMRDALPARVKMAFDAVAPELGRQLSAATGERSEFDVLLGIYEATYKAAELKAVAECFVGFGVDKKKKGDLIKVMRNFQREGELSDSLHAAQSKVPV